MPRKSLALLALCCLPAPLAIAQSDVGGLFSPWITNDRVELQAEVTHLDQAKVETANDAGIGLTYYQSQGRWRLMDEFKINPTVGYNFLAIDIDAPDVPILPGQLLDQSIGVASPLGQSGDWFYGAAAGIGYAGNRPFDDSDAIYARGTVIVGREFGPDSNLIIGLDYDGNRTIFPDIPLIGFAYTFRIADEVRAVVGLPATTIYFEPADVPLRVDLIYRLSDEFAFQLSYKIIEQLNVFATFDTRRDAFKLNDDDSNDRLFFRQRRIELGLRWDPMEEVGFTIAGGYAFDQDIDRGFDSRNLDTVADVSDEVYFRVGALVRF